jgi:hypothetical protein
VNYGVLEEWKKLNTPALQYSITPATISFSVFFYANFSLLELAAVEPQKLPGHNQVLNLPCSFIDVNDFAVAHPLFRKMLFRPAQGTEKLTTFLRDKGGVPAGFGF